MKMTVKNFRPINNMLLVKRDKSESETTKTLDSGIIVVQSEETKDKSRDCIATVIKVGDYVYNKNGNKHDLKEMFHPGDKIVYYNPAGATRIQIEGEEYILLRAEDIDAILEEE